MKKWDIKWSDEYLSGVDTIDSAHKTIVEKGMRLQKEIANPEHDIDEMYDLAMKISEKILEHMPYETDLMKKLGIPEYLQHEENHDFYKERFDLDKHYDLSKKMRLLMISQLICDYMTFHFNDYDLPDLKKVAEKIAKN